MTTEAYATKTEVSGLVSSLAARISDAQRNMSEMETRLNHRIDGVEDRLTGKIDTVRTELLDAIGAMEDRLTQNGKT